MLNWKGGRARPSERGGSQWLWLATISSSFIRPVMYWPGRHAGDRAGEDVIEHQRRDAELGEAAAQGLLDHAVNAAAGEHGAALHVDRAHREAEQHDAEDEPGGGGAYSLLGDAAGIKGRGAQVIENDGGSAPKGDEREHHRGCHDEPDAVGRRSYGRSARCHLKGAGGSTGCLRVGTQYLRALR